MKLKTNFNNLTNKFEEINFKLDKLSSRLSKVQADNQIRFLDLENKSVSIKKEINTSPSSEVESDTKSTKLLPGSSQPQDLGSISYKDSETKQSTQQTQSIETTTSIITENFESEEKLLPNVPQKNNMNLQQVF